MTQATLRPISFVKGSIRKNKRQQRKLRRRQWRTLFRFFLTRDVEAYRASTREYEVEMTQLTKLRVTLKQTLRNLRSLGY